MELSNENENKTYVALDGLRAFLYSNMFWVHIIIGGISIVKIIDRLRVNRSRQCSNVHILTHVRIIKRNIIGAMHFNSETIFHSNFVIPLLYVVFYFVPFLRRNPNFLISAV